MIRVKAWVRAHVHDCPACSQLCNCVPVQWGGQECEHCPNTTTT